MASDLERALSNKLGGISNSDALLQAMKTLLVLLLQEESETEEDAFATELGNRIKDKYPRPSSLANHLIPKPM